jgi:hypothetical protein
VGETKNNPNNAILFTLFADFFKKGFQTLPRFDNFTYIPNFNNQVMKKIILTGLVLALFLLSYSAFSQSPVTFDFKVNITDNCGGIYHGDYCVICSIYEGTTLLCTSSPICGLRAGQDEEISFKCSVDHTSSAQIYSVVVTGYRNTNPITCQNSHTNGLFYWADITNGTALCTVTL